MRAFATVPMSTALASRDARAITVLLWNYHDDDLPAEPAGIDLTIDGVPDGNVRVTHERIDADRSNAYQAWKRMGQPQPPSAEQILALKKTGQLQALEAPRMMRAPGGRIAMAFTLPRQGVSLVTVSW